MGEFTLLCVKSGVRFWNEIQGWLRLKRCSLQALLHPEASDSKKRERSLTKVWTVTNPRDEIYIERCILMFLSVHFDGYGL